MGIRVSLAQNLGSYVIPFSNNKYALSGEKIKMDAQEILLQSMFPQTTYPKLSFSYLYRIESLGANHYTYQINFDQIPIEQGLLKMHVAKSDGSLQLLQTNLPDPAIWNQFRSAENIFESKGIWLVLNNELILCEKYLIVNEAKDFYSERFNINDFSYFENELKYHNDSTAYAKVFNPDPLTTANQVYGGFYQDALSKDTSGIFIQNVNNPGGTTVTANGTTFNFDGQTFNVPTESYLNSFTAPTLRQVFENIFLDGQGNILGFNTAITDNLATYTTQIIREDYNYPSLASEQVWKSFSADFSAGRFNLRNDYFIISEFSSPFTNPATSATDSFDFNRSELGFEDVNAFYHLNNYRDYWLSLGFTGLDSEILLVDAHGNNGADNSFFSPTSPPRLVFGQGGVDDAEDADVIIHEYAHAISNFASPGSNSGVERRGLDEGFGDYLATSYSRQLNMYNSDLVFSWDGHNEFWAGRISNSNKTKEDLDVNQNIYFNGEIWSSTLMDLHAEIGSISADKLALEVMYYNMPNGTIQEAAENLFLADTSIFNGLYSCQIFDVLFARKFLEGTCTDFYSGIKHAFTEDVQVSLVNTDGFTKYNQDLLLICDNCAANWAMLSVINIAGKYIKSIPITENKQALELSELDSGIYFLKLETHDKAYRFKVIKN